MGTNQMTMPAPPQGFTLENAPQQAPGNAPKPPDGFNMEIPKPPPGFGLEGKSQSINAEKPGFWDDFLKPTLKDIVKVPAAIVGGMAAFPVSGIAGLSKLITSGPEEAVKTIEAIQGVPMRWIKTPAEQQAINIITKPMQWIDEAGQYFGDKVYENWPDKNEAAMLGAATKTAFQITAYFGLPKLAGKLNAEIKAGNTLKLKQAIRDVHAERLRILQEEPQRLTKLAEAEQRLKGPVKRPYQGPGTILQSYEAPKPSPSIFPDTQAFLRQATERVGGQYGVSERPIPNLQDMTVREYGQKLTDRTLPPIVTRGAIRTGDKMDILREFYQDAAKASRGERIPDNLKDAFKIMKDDVSQGSVERTGGEYGHIIASTYPEWFRGKGISKNEFFNIVNNAEEGKTLTDNQAAKFKEFKDIAENINRTHPDLVGAQDIEAMRGGGGGDIQQYVTGKTMRKWEDSAPEEFDPNLFNFLGTESAYRKIAAETGALIQKSKEVGQTIVNVLDVEAPWKRVNAPETGFTIKNYYSKRAANEEYGLKRASDNAKMFKYDRNIAPDVILGHENPSYFNSLPKNVQQKIRPAIQDLNNFLNDYKEGYAKRGIKLDFKTRIINDIQDLIETAEKPEDVAALKNAQRDAQQMEFTHIPSALWFENTLNKDPVQGNAVLRLLATQKRKTLLIKDLIDREVIKRENIHPADVMASYSRRAGRDFALLDIVDAATKEGMASRSPKEGFVQVPAYKAPVLSKYYVHPMLAEQISDMVRPRSMNPFEKASVSVKMAAFFNPIFLPMYDTVQGAMLGSMRSIKTPKYLIDGFKDTFKKTPAYWEALDHGLASQPFNNPFDSWVQMLEGIKRSKGETVVKLFENVMPHKAIKSLYNLSWNLAWELDKGVRMASYRYLIDKGYSPREAAQIAAKFHSDYASVPPGTRKVLNHIFFTPTFKITMGKLHGQMMIDMVKTIGKLGKVDKTTKLYAKGLLATGAILEGWDMFMRAQGFQADEWGRRYVKRVQTDEGEKEVVVTYSNPANMFLKYLYRAKESLSPEVDRSMMKFFELNKWEYNRLAQIGYEVVSGKSATGEDIFSTFDTPAVQTAKRLEYVITRTLPLLSAMGIGKDPSNKEAQEAFKKETSQLLELITRPVTFKYMRSAEEQRAYYKLNKIKKQYSDLARQGKLEEKHSAVFLKKIQEIISGISKEQ